MGTESELCKRQKLLSLLMRWESCPSSRCLLTLEQTLAPLFFVFRHKYACF